MKKYLKLTFAMLAATLFLASTIRAESNASHDNEPVAQHNAHSSHENEPAAQHQSHSSSHEQETVGQHRSHDTGATSQSNPSNNH